MFDHIWDCEIDHPVFQDTVGDLMKAVIQAYEKHNLTLSTNLAEVGTDCISRQAAIDAFNTNIDELVVSGKENADAVERYLNRVIDEIKQLPPIQPKRGKWIHHPEIGWGETWLCDQCGEKTTSTVMGKPRANFCPNCGSDMREATE